MVSKKELRVGLAVFGNGNPKVEYFIQKIRRDCFTPVNEKYSSFEFPELIKDFSIAQKASDFFQQKMVDMLLLLQGTWTGSNPVVEVAEKVSVPIAYWAPEDPLGIAFSYIGNLVGLTQNAGVLSKLGIFAKLIYGKEDDPIQHEIFDKFAQVALAIKNLKRSRVGVIGMSGSPGMLDTEYHLLALKKVLGVEVFKIPFVDFIKRLNSVKDFEVKTALDEDRLIKRIKVDPGSEYDSFRIYLALKKISDEFELNATAFRCWPELLENGINSPCLALSKMSDSGVVSACEGDLTGAVSMLLLNNLTGNPAYLGDILKVNKEKQEMYLFHCGAAARALAASTEEVSFRLHPEPATWKPGVTVDFTIKPGRVTFARIGEFCGNYRIIVYTGTATKSEDFVRGNAMTVKLDKDTDYVIKKIVEFGSEHHQIAVHGDVSQEVRDFAILTGLRLQQV